LNRDHERKTQYLVNAQSARRSSMRDIATAALSGNLTRDVELRALPSGADVARLRVATTTRRRSGEEWVEKTNYFTVEVFGAQTRRCAQYLHKGSRVVVDAELDWREWTDSEEPNRRRGRSGSSQAILAGEGRASPTRPFQNSEPRSPGPRMCLAASR
jgi:single stranded DNA-binding protein